MIKVVCDYSDVLRGVASLDSKFKSITPMVFQSLVNSGTMHVFEALIESYHDPKSYAGGGKVRAEWTRSRNLQRAIINSRVHPIRIPTGVIAGVGDRNILDSQAPYWEEIEEGTSKYVDQLFMGYWLTEEGIPRRSSEERWGMDKWVEAPSEGDPMFPEAPILPHHYFYKGNEEIRKDFYSELNAIIGKVLG